MKYSSTLAALAALSPRRSSFSRAEWISDPYGAPPTGRNHTGPQFSDWIQVNLMVARKIDESSCPDMGTLELATHLDYGLCPLYANGTNTAEELGVLMGCGSAGGGCANVEGCQVRDGGGLPEADCDRFKRERNPHQMGSRLVRHAFHDAVGGFDGFIDITDEGENGGLASTYYTLVEMWNTETLSNALLSKDCVDADATGGACLDETPLKEVLSWADFNAWAAIAAFLKSVRNHGTSDCGTQKHDEGDHIPTIPVSWGRENSLLYVEGEDHLWPDEPFPVEGPSSCGKSLFDYFTGASAEGQAAGWSFEPHEIVALMGAHTFGGARPIESGYQGMWTHSKNAFNNEYQSTLLDPIPMDCPQNAHGPDNCQHFSINGLDRPVVCTDDAIADGGDSHGYKYSDRCHGWEQIRLRNANQEGLSVHTSDKFQWRNSCLPAFDGSGTEIQTVDRDCTDMMLNADMGINIDLDGYVCLKNNSANSCPDGEVCLSCLDQGEVRHGMVYRFPDKGGETCVFDNGPPNYGRILASCFEKNVAQHGVNANGLLQAHSGLLGIPFDDPPNRDAQNSWMDSFSVIFAGLLEHKVDTTLVELNVHDPYGTWSALDTWFVIDVENGMHCPCDRDTETGDEWEVPDGGPAFISCNMCSSGYCKQKRGIFEQPKLCSGDTPPDPVPTQSPVEFGGLDGEDCPVACCGTVCDGPDSGLIDCASCNSGKCRFNNNQAKYVCKNAGRLLRGD